MAESKLTPEAHERICAALLEGNTRTDSAEAAGIDYSTFRRWILRGRKGEEPYRAFCAGVKKAEAQASQKAIKIILTAAANGAWQASAWWLERKYPDRWGSQRSEVKKLIEMLKEQQGKGRV